MPHGKNWTYKLEPHQRRRYWDTTKGFKYCAPSEELVRYIHAADQIEHRVSPAMKRLSRYDGRILRLKELRARRLQEAEAEAAEKGEDDVEMDGCQDTGDDEEDGDGDSSDSESDEDSSDEDSSDEDSSDQDSSDEDEDDGRVGRTLQRQDDEEAYIYQREGSYYSNPTEDPIEYHSPQDPDEPFKWAFKTVWPDNRGGDDPGAQSIQQPPESMPSIPDRETTSKEKDEKAMKTTEFLAKRAAEESMD
ncbi:hypothetical protein DM02DRAFT_666362 [Periconia macrospinosa]|uniref:Uncharacterized protein n=1 Tax=Periconia macrospinosa TaxID=97972 RepID=A0A2V1ECP5_9PLEO|nr:hypothetical protein DM02DRAFT_666362 [Periconia macrospinosa]